MKQVFNRRLEGVSLAQISNWMAWMLAGLYAVFCIVTFFVAVEPSLRGAIPIRLYSDSDQYMDAARQIEMGETSPGAFLAFSANYVVCTSLALLLKTWGLIALFNAGVFLAGCWSLNRAFPSFKWYVFLPLILLTPSGYVSLLTLNKEIFVFFCACRLAAWFVKPSAWNMLFVVAFSLALRWEQALTILVFLAFYKLRVPPKKAAVLLILGISISFPFAVHYLQQSEGLPDQSSSDFYLTLSHLQEYGLFFLLIVPKVLIFLTSHVLRFWQTLEPQRLQDPPTGVFVAVDQVFMCAVTIWAWRKKLWTPSTRPVIYFVMVYVIITVGAPLNAPRYMWLAYIMMAIVLSSERLQRLPHRRVAAHSDSLGGSLGYRRPSRLPEEPTPQIP